MGLFPKILPELVSGRGTALRSRVVEGQARNRCPKHSIGFAFNILQYFRCGNAKGFNTLFVKPIVSRHILIRAITKIMRHTINLHRKPRIITIEIENIRTGRMLPPEFQAIRSLPKLLPEHDFRKRHVFTQTPRFADSDGMGFGCVIFQHDVASTGGMRLRAAPPPCFAWSPSFAEWGRISGSPGRSRTGTVRRARLA